MGAQLVNAPSTPGRFRPVQGLIQVYAVYGGIRGLVAGITPGSPLEQLLGGEPDWVSYLFWLSLLFGGLISIVGELIQLSCPIINHTKKELERFINGQLIERAGDFLIAMNYGAYAIGIIVSPEVQDARAYPFLAIALGFLGRTGQLVLEHRRLTVKGAS